MGKITAILIALLVLTVKADDFDFYSVPEQLRQEPVQPPQLISPLEIEKNDPDVQRKYIRRSKRLPDKPRVDKPEPKPVDFK